MGIILCSCSSRKQLPSKDDDTHVYNVSSGNSYTLGERKILDIIKLQEDLFADPNINNMGNFAYSELQTKAMRIESMWRTYFIENPNDVSALIIYGKFLRRIGQEEKAYETFVHADSINPSIAVVKQQLSALEAEQGLSKKAFLHIKDALAIAPDNPIYLKQCAYILIMAKTNLINENVLSFTEFDKILSRCYQRIHEQNPNDKAEKIRYAQSFYDLFKPDWQKALSLWNEILQESTLNIERQTAFANIARVLVELNRDAEAEDILKNVDAKNLQHAKKMLLSEIKRQQKATLQK